MGNVLRFLCGQCCKPEVEEGAPQRPHYLGPHGVTSSTVGVSALAQDILHFDATSQVPDGLNSYVVSSKQAQAKWYGKLSAAWKEAKPPPRDPEGTARLVVLALKRHRKADVEGLLRYYGLPYIDGLVGLTGSVPSSWPEGVKFQFETLPVDEKAVVDGDGITVYVDTSNPRESSEVPIEVQEAAIQREEARAARNFDMADALYKKITDAGYRVVKGLNNEDVLARKYRIRLRGIDAPESQMPYGKESKAELLKLVEGRCLKLQVYDVDRYDRYVADIYCNDIFIQEVMLRRGFAWHYVAYDKRPEFAMWEQEARAARRGLWAQKNPEKPWEWRKARRNGT